MKLHTHLKTKGKRNEENLCHYSRRPGGVLCAPWGDRAVPGGDCCAALTKEWDAWLECEKKGASQPLYSFANVIAEIVAVELSFAHQFGFAAFEQDFVALAAVVRASVRVVAQLQFSLAECREL
jgi:hypothetical protein